ncbi:MAG: hypothetical protein KF784_02000 [Fimbriimonadaceae bacterium]|nr:hypothetical protein [Fimbriimonadaceae bacterium]
MKDVRTILTMAALALVLAGCGDGSGAAGSGVTMPGASGNAGTRPVEKPNADAGVGFEVKPDEQRYAMLWSNRNFGGSRRDPFALKPNEVAYDYAQLTERLTSDFGWDQRFEPEPEVTVQERPQPQPYRRLAGVIIGDTVTAIIIMEDGRAVQIHPGMQIPNSPWTVISIDENKAILRRGGNVKPNDIIVNLESAPPGAGGRNSGGNAGGNAGGRGGRGGRQGGPGLGTSGG